MERKVVLILCCVYLVYVILGGVIFHFIESPQEQSTKRDSSAFREKFLSNFTCISSAELDAFLSRVVKAYDDGVFMTNQTTADNWDLTSSVLFSITVVTTIGYGNIAPSTTGGKVFCIFYALCGIPITALMLLGIGEKLWDRLERLGRHRRCQQNERTWKTVRIAAFVASGVVLLMVMPATVFMTMEGWDWGSAFYYAFITMTTIGFGDYVPGMADSSYRGIYRVIVGVWIVLGLAWLSTVISVAQNLFTGNIETTMDKIETKHNAWIDKNAKSDRERNDTTEYNQSRTGSRVSTRTTVNPI